MSSLRRQLSSKANGSLSRGPVTPEGKARSSQNALTHGLLADCVVLPGESEEGFKEVVTAHLERFGPIDDVEHAMVEEMAASHWRLRRSWAMENELLTNGIDFNADGDDRARITASFRKLASSPELALLHRYETRLHMMYQRAFHNVLLMRTVGPRTVEQALVLATPALVPVLGGVPSHSQDSTQPEVAPQEHPLPQLPRPDVAYPCQPELLPTPPPLPAHSTPGIPNEPNPISGHPVEQALVLATPALVPVHGGVPAPWTEVSTPDQAIATDARHEPPTATPVEQHFPLKTFRESADIPGSIAGRRKRKAGGTVGAADIDRSTH